MGDQLTKQIDTMEDDIAPLQDQVDEIMRATDFGHGEELLASGMASYLNALNRLKPDVWRHSGVDVNLSRSGFSIKAGPGVEHCLGWSGYVVLPDGISFLGFFR